MSFDNTKYDIELNEVPYRVKAYQKGDALAFIPRVGSSGQTESEFNLLLSRTIRGFDGGILQKLFKDESSIYGSEGLYPVYDDGVLYPVDAFVDPSATTALIGKSILTAWVQTKDYVYIAYQSYNAPTNYVKRIDRSGTQQSITLPASLSNGSRIISAMTMWNNQIWFGTTDGAKQHYLDISSTTAVEIGGTGGFYQMVVLKGSLYGTNAGVGTANSRLFKYTGDLITAAFTEVGNTGKQSDDFTGKLLIFNNRIFLLRKDGMYAYDGVSFQTIEDTSENWNALNFMFGVVLKGYMYYWMPDGMYRYNGSLIEKLYDIQEVGTPVDVCLGKNRIWILYSNTGNSANVSRYDKSMGYDYSSSNDIQGRIAVFNGKAMYTYGRTTTFVKNPATEDFSGQGEVTRLFWFADKLYVTTNYDKTGSYHRVNTDELSLTGTKSWSFVTSVDDFDFPMIQKNLESVELVFDGTVVAQTIQIDYRDSGFEGTTAFSNYGSIVSSPTESLFNKNQTWEELPDGLSVKRIQLKISGTTNVSYGIAKVVSRYTLAPDFKWQWSFTLLNYGDSSTAPLMLADGSQGTQAVQDLRGNLYAVRDSAVPVVFIDIDQLDLNEALDAIEADWNLNSTKLIKGSSGFIKIDDEIMYWYQKSGNTLTGIRGVLGTTPATHADNAKVFIVYRVLVTQINPERVFINDDGQDIPEDKSKPSEISVIVREI